MDREDIKKILAGISITGLLAGSSLLGCTPTTQETQTPSQEAPATHEEPAPAEQPAPSS